MTMAENLQKSLCDLKGLKSSQFALGLCSWTGKQSEHGSVSRFNKRIEIFPIWYIIWCCVKFVGRLLTVKSSGF